MPVIKLWCLPETDEDFLRALHVRVVTAVEHVEVLGLKGEAAMTVLFPKDMMSYGLGTEIVVEVTGLFKKPERTPEVQNQLARNLGVAVKEFFPDAKVECFVNPFNPAQGFWSSDVASPFVLMTVQEYFTEERFRVAGVDPKRHLSRTINSLHYANAKGKLRVVTVSDLISCSEKKLLDVRHMGRKTCRAMQAVLAYDGLTLAPL